MCDTCDRARKLPRDQAFKLIAQAMQQRGAPLCLDRLIGEMVGEPEPIVDRAAESAWEKRRSRR